MIHDVMIGGDDAVGGEDESAAAAQVPLVALSTLVPSHNRDGFRCLIFIKCGPVRLLNGLRVCVPRRVGQPASLARFKLLDECVSVQKSRPFVLQLLHGCKPLGLDCLIVNGSGWIGRVGERLFFGAVGLRVTVDGRKRCSESREEE